MGVSASSEAHITPSIERFMMGWRDNPHGWGVGVYGGRAVSIFKEAAASSTSSLLSTLTQSGILASRLLVSHIRNMTVGCQSLANTHPFTRELHGQDHLFAHNGTLRRVRDITTEHYQPVGTTDSEHAFCVIMDSLRLAGRHATREERIEAVSDAVDTIITRELEVPHPSGGASAKLNVLLSDGELLIAYNSGFRPMSRAHHTFDDGTTIAMVASEPLDDEFSWERMDIGEFIVLEQGTIIDHRHINGCPPEMGGITARSSQV